MDKSFPLIKRCNIIAVLVVLVNYAFAIDTREMYESVKDKIVIIQCDDSSGSGFVCEMNGKRYLVTNRHVVEGQSRVFAVFPDGKSLKIGKMEIAKNDVDLVRFIVATNQPTLKVSLEAPSMKQRIFVFGNSDGSGAITYLPGEVVGIGPDKIEISAKIVHGNSGSAVLNEDGEVVGVASSATRENNPKDWVKQDTRFTEIRRWALRFDQVAWEPMELKTLFRIAKAKREERQKKYGVFPQVKASFKAPSMRVNKYQTHWDARYWINGNIVLSLSSVKDIKNPIVRVVMLVNCGKEKVVMDAIAIEPYGEYKYSSVPVFSYGMKSLGQTFEVNDVSVYYVEAISYYQRSAALSKAKDIEYFDKKIFLRGGFRVPYDKVLGKDIPNIMAFRFECWQNGSLAGVFNSMRPDTLNSKRIPVDWFVIGRYPELFSYCKTCYEQGWRN